MFVIRPLFSKFQRELVAFANTNYGRNFVSQFGGSELKENYPIVKITPDGIHQDMGGGTYRAVSHSHSPYVGLFASVLTTLDIAFENNKRIQDPKLQHLVIPHFMGETLLLKNELPQIYLAEATFNPDADPEDTSVDGNIATGSSVGTTWANARNATTGFHQDSTGQELMCRVGKYVTTGNFGIWRGIFLFDVSSIAGATISAANFQAYVISKRNGDNDGDDYVSLVNATPASNNDLINDDFNNFDNTELSSQIDIGSASTGAYNTWTLNAGGITAVQTAVDGDNIVKLGAKEGHDILNHAYVGANNTWNDLEIYFADNGSNEPKLVVTYTVPGVEGTAARKTLLGVGR